MKDSSTKQLPPHHKHSAQLDFDAGDFFVYFALHQATGPRYAAAFALVLSNSGDPVIWGETSAFGADNPKDLKQMVDTHLEIWTNKTEVDLRINALIMTATEVARTSNFFWLVDVSKMYPRDFVEQAGKAMQAIGAHAEEPTAPINIRVTPRAEVVLHLLPYTSAMRGIHGGTSRWHA